MGLLFCRNNCPVKTFEVKTQGDPAQFNGKSNARLFRAVLVTCVHFKVLFIWVQLIVLSTPYLSSLQPPSSSPHIHTHAHTHTLPSFSNLNGFSLSSSKGLKRRRQRSDVYSDFSVILKIFVGPTNRLYLRLGRPIAHS